MRLLGVTNQQSSDVTKGHHSTSDARQLNIVSQEVSGNCHQNAQFECRYPHDRAVLCKVAMQAA